METEHEPPGGEKPTDDKPPGRLTELKLLGRRLCLDFVNTIQPRVGGRPWDYLTDYVELARWAELAGVVAAGTAREMEQLAALEPLAAEHAFRRAIDFREALYRVLAAVAAGAAPEPTDLDVINAAWSEALAHSRIAPEGDGFSWGWMGSAGVMDGVWWPIARSAVELLTSPELHRVRQCPGSNCGWLFLDTSRKGNRRWCSMEGCGNRAKARRHYALKLARAGV